MKPKLLLRAGLLIVYAAGLALFYYKYVPLIASFQTVLVPILITIVILTWRNLETGILTLIFAVPLISNLPYFFHLYEPLPLAPTALVLFLFFFLGWLLRGEPFETLVSSCPASLRKPIILFASFTALSALIVFFRYANFFPFLSGRIYELTTNRFGVTAGGAIMSVVLESLNYLTGFALFLLVFRVLRSRILYRRALLLLNLGSSLSLAFALYQKFGHPALGNNPISINLGLINGTFKDALSFGTFLSMATPLFAGILISESTVILRFLAGLNLGLSLYLILFTGSKSGIISLGVALGVFFIWEIVSIPRRGNRWYLSRPAAMVAALVLIGLAAGAVIFGKAFLIKVAPAGLVQRFQQTETKFRFRLEHFWKPAFAMMVDYPVSGIGAGSYIIEVANYSEFYKAAVATPESAENYLIHVGSEFGIFGLGAIVWIVWSILRQTRSGYRSIGSSPDRKARHLFIGAASGVLAFFVNAQAHTYAGSYEIKYTFWFFVGLLFYLPALTSGEQSPERDRLSEGQNGPGEDRFKKLAVGLMVLFGATLLWNSTHSLSLKARTERFGLKQDFGLDRWEKTEDGREFRWTRDHGGLDLIVEKPMIVIPVHAAHSDIKAHPVRLEIYLEKDFFRSAILMKSVVIDRNDWQEISLSLRGETGSRIILLFKVSRTWNPLKETGAPDPRHLGVAIGRVEFRDAE